MTLAPSELYSVVMGSDDEDCDYMYYYPRGPQGGLETTKTCATWAFKSSRVVNLADLDSPIPSKVYFPVGNNTGKTITENKYFPMIALPSQILEHEPAFASCLPFSTWSFFDLNRQIRARIISVWDPPKAIEGTDVIKPPDVTAHTVTPSASINSTAPAGIPHLFDRPSRTVVLEESMTKIAQLPEDPSRTAMANAFQTLTGQDRLYVFPQMLVNERLTKLAEDLRARITIPVIRFQQQLWL